MVFPVEVSVMASWYLNRTPGNLAIARVYGLFVFIIFSSIRDSSIFVWMKMFEGFR